jgi:gluconolactonase
MLRHVMSAVVLTSGFVAVGAVRADEQANAERIPGLGPSGPIRKLHTGLQFTEGPAAGRSGNLYFTDIPANRIYKLDAQGQLSVFLEPSMHANGLMFFGDGRLAACQMDGQLVAIDVGTRSVTTLADRYEGRRFNAPNDLVIDRAGGIYFTDPHFRAPQPLPQGKRAVYYRSPAGQVTRVTDDLPAPNGVILSPDEQTLYVIPSLHNEMLAYPVTSAGELGEGRVFCTLKQRDGPSRGIRGGDGLAVDVKGNLYITSALGLQVFSPQGRVLGVLPFPEQPANVTFGGPEGRTLYVTARTSLYAVEMEVAGHVFPAGGP